MGVSALISKGVRRMRWYFQPPPVRIRSISLGWLPFSKRISNLA